MRPAQRRLILMMLTECPEKKMRRQAFVPLLTYPESNSDAVAANAVAMAGRLDCDLHALAIDADIPNVGNALARLTMNLPDLIRQAEANSQKRGQQLLSRLALEAEAIGVSLTTETIVQNSTLMSDAAVMHARYHDLALCGWEAGNDTSRALAEAVVFGAGRPTILLPELVPVGALDHVAIAWDGSRVAARALADAAPLLAHAATISVITVLDDKPLPENAPGDRLAGHLADRGLDARSFSIRMPLCSIEACLQDKALALGAGILVMGAFGHSRMRDFVLGGATRGVLADLRLPVMLSH